MSVILTTGIFAGILYIAKVGIDAVINANNNSNANNNK